MKHIWLALLGGAVVIIAILAMTTENRILNINPVNSFAECVAAGNPVMESYPEQCRDKKSGRTFTNPEQTTLISEEETVTVGPQTRKCVDGEVPRTCLVVNGELFFSNIDGFGYEPGYEYELRIKKFSAVDSPADGSDVRYELVEVLKKTSLSEIIDETDGEGIGTTTTNSKTTCIRAGCSNQLCVDSRAEPTMTTCEYREEYACYAQAPCELQSDGQCGFSLSASNMQCIAAAQAASDQ